ncbi:uncharacterized protein LOC125137482 [Phacochoerus africanus]|uniref:uncharacterized protein LOC125137482 n=1 Tax=Phacochoerus africanus TaxID=41426 RepID=UPI001FDA148D|nr:uncharacterized protein LOC125137482 [Phacochoerus africanus]
MRVRDSKALFLQQLRKTHLHYTGRSLEMNLLLPLINSWENTSLTEECLSARLTKLRYTSQKRSYRIIHNLPRRVSLTVSQTCARKYTFPLLDLSHTVSRSLAPPRPGPSPAWAPPQQPRAGRAGDRRGRAAAGLVLLATWPARRALETPDSGECGRSRAAHGRRSLPPASRLGPSGSRPGQRELAAGCARPESCVVAAAGAAAGSTTRTGTRWLSGRRRGRSRSRSPGRPRGGAGGGQRRSWSRILKNRKITLVSLLEMTTKRWEHFLVN